ncbi:MAG: ABC transporter substrate-binding protein [Treponema sp.]|jgi:putative aldouronate transport system substrate-binding protein|nr:ABC transporter substrate-binding protein [Treponema sp.]
MKKNITLVAGLLVVYTLVSCVQTKSEQKAAEAGEPYEIVMTYLFFGTVPRDLQMIEDAINKISIPAVNAKVTLYPLDAFQAATQTNLMISSGEKLDLMMVLFQGGPINYVNSNQILELDDLYAKYGADIAAAEGIAMAGGYINNILYAIPSEEKYGRQFGLFVRNDILNKYRFDKKEWDMVSYTDLDTLFTRIKAGEGENFYMLTLTRQSNIMPFQAFHVVDTLGATMASGGLMNGGLDNTTVVNVFATPEYKEHLKWFRKWYQAGYLAQDCATMTESDMDLMRGGHYLGSLYSVEADMKAKFIQDSRWNDVMAFNTGERFAITSIYQISVWTIPITCKDPETTFKFLNLMYQSEEINNLLHNGIEGVHYVRTDEPGIIAYPEGITMENTGYFNSLGIWGDKLKRYQYPPLTSSYFDELREFNATIDASVISKALGYTFNSFTVRTEFAAITDVISQYQLSLESGSLDPDVVLPQFLEALKAAGIDKVIAENQRQLDAWLTAKK